MADLLQLEFVHGVQLVYFVSFEFRDTHGNLITLGELRRFAALEQSAGRLSGLRGAPSFDKKQTYYSFFDRFCSDEFMPLVVQTDVGVTQGSTSTREEVSVPEVVTLRLSTYGAASIRVTYRANDGQGRVFDNRFLDDVVSRLAASAKTYGKVAWASFAKEWNAVSQSKLANVEPIDVYLVSVVDGAEVVHSGGRFPLAGIKRGGLPITSEDLSTVRRMLVGLAVTSYLWPTYTDTYVERFLSADRAYSTKELQFVAWQNALIYREMGEQEHPVPYAKYVYDMILGLEVVFMLRTSLQLLDTTADDRLGFRLVGAATDPFQLFRLAEYQRALTYLDRWFLVLANWRSIGRCGKISHFSDYLEGAAEAMRVNNALSAAGEKIAFLRDVVKSQLERATALNVFALTVVLAILTLALLLKG